MKEREREREREERERGRERELQTLHSMSKESLINSDLSNKKIKGVFFSI
jgi:hypothetical protein